MDTACKLSLSRLLSLLRLGSVFVLCISSGDSRYCDIGRFRSFFCLSSGNNSGAVSILIETSVKNNVLDFLFLAGHSLCLLGGGCLGSYLGCFILFFALFFALQVVSSVSRRSYCVIGCEHKSIRCILAYNCILRYCLFELFVIDYASAGNHGLSLVCLSGCCFLSGNNLCRIAILEDGGCQGTEISAFIGRRSLTCKGSGSKCVSYRIFLSGSDCFLSSLCRFLSSICRFLCIISCYLRRLCSFLSGRYYLICLFCRYGGLIGFCGFGCSYFAAFNACKLINALSLCVSGLGGNDLAVSGLNCDSILRISANDNGLDNLALNLGRCFKNLSLSTNDIGFSECALNGVNVAGDLIVCAYNFGCSESTSCSINCLNVLLVCACNGGICKSALVGLNLCNILCISARNVR